jgi:hypothetical protein
MIVYGIVPPTWVIAQGFEMRKYIPQREKPLDAFAIYDGPPVQKPLVPFKFPGMCVLECRKSLDVDEDKLRDVIGSI